MASQPLLSIIITSYNTERLKDIFELFDSIRTQTYSNIETIFVAERSRELYERVKEYVDQNAIPIVQIIFNERECGLSESRNLGIMHAKGDIIGFVDDDVVLSNSWAGAVTKALSKDNNIIGVTGPAFPLWEDKSLSWLPEEFHWVISCTTWFNQRGVKPIRNAWGHNMVFKREAFNICGLFPTEFGYHKGAMAEDIGFSMKVRLKTRKNIVYDSEIGVLHKVHGYRLSWRFIVERSYWIGHSRRMLKRLYSSSDEELFDMENSILKRVMLNLPIKIVRTFFRKPIESLNILSVSTIILVSVALGYLRNS